ncbi:MAG: hypothetical protein PHW64_03680 [Sulfuricurvum sp.]|nr:hypothetical protein [Sulfuricurvum sp.]
MESSKRKNETRSQAGTDEQGKERDKESGIEKNILKQVSRLVQMNEEMRADKMYEMSVQQMNDANPISTGTQEENGLEDEEELTGASDKLYLKPAQYIPDEVALENEFPIPDFSKPSEKKIAIPVTDEEQQQAPSKKTIQSLPKKNTSLPTKKIISTPKKGDAADEKASDAESESNVIEADGYMSEAQQYELLLQHAEHETFGTSFEESDEDTGFSFVDMIQFERQSIPSRDFISRLFETLSKASGNGSVYVDFTSDYVFIEKNYFALCVRNIICYENRLRFDSVFLMPDATKIYDGEQINLLTQAIANAHDIDMFDAHGKNKSRRLFNFLFASAAVEDLYITGWFLKIKRHHRPELSEFVSAFAREAEVITVSGKPDEIERKIKILKNVKKTL